MHWTRKAFPFTLATAIYVRLLHGLVPLSTITRGKLNECLDVTIVVSMNGIVLMFFRDLEK